MKMLTILATEDVNKEGILDILDKYLEGYTVVKAKGTWQGVPENSLLIYIVGTPFKPLPNTVTKGGEYGHSTNRQFTPYMDEIVKEIKDINDQDSIMVLTIPCGVEFK